MAYRIKTFITSSGERLSQLYDCGAYGFPVFYSAAFIARSIRLNATHETQKVYLSAIKRVYEWGELQKIDLEFRLHCCQFLSLYEIDSLTNYIRINKLSQMSNTISPAKYNTYLSYAAEYIRWLSYEVITDTNRYEIRSAINTQNDALIRKKRRKQGSYSARKQRILNEKLSSEAREQLTSLFSAPFDDSALPENIGQRFRNIIILRLLYETGMRIGELLSLKLKHFQESGGEESAFIVIERNHNDPLDTRLHQPVAKTAGRIIPISEELEAQLYSYIINWRADVAGTGFSGDDFIFINHRGGRNQGKPLQKKTFESGMKNLKRIFPVLTSIHPHLLRHDWNYRFSLIADENHLSEEQESALRENLMGWQPGSTMSAVYNRRHIHEKAHQFGLMVANMTNRVIK